MSYKITATEKNNKKSADFETKSLLYLLNYHIDKDEIHFFVIDFFNDVSGVDKYGTKIWDVQSKGKFVTATSLGACLITLFKNFLSSFSSKFTHFILYVEGISSKILVTSTLLEFDISNIKTPFLEDVKNGLIKEAMTVSYIIDYGYSSDDLLLQVDFFLEKVKFVVDSKTQVEMIKDTANIDNSIYPSDSYLESIFKQIRDNQSGKKSIATEGIIIENVSDFAKFKKYILAGDIILLITSRLINMDITKDKKVPISFIPHVSSMDDSEKYDFIEECQDGIYRMMFDKNNVINYWLFFENVWKVIKNNPSDTIESLFTKLDSKRIKPLPMDFNSIKYFISVVKDGLSI